MDVNGKSAIVTGGGTGLGRATCLKLAALGCNVLVNYSRSKDQAEETAADAKRLGVKAIAWKADVSIDAECRAMVDAATGTFGHLHLLVNNAGTTRFIRDFNLDEVKDEDWEKVMNVNLKGPFLCARAARDAINKAGGGVIINVSSSSGINALGSSIPYCASKAALINLTISLARVLAPMIRVNAVAPSFIEGDWLKRGFGKNYDKLKEANEKRALLGKVSTADDVADAILSLITGSELVTGQVLLCDGGRSLAP
ncbi:MAG: SDR family NAD(P)-dependent oxidoreductase [bacterium]